MIDFIERPIDRQAAAFFCRGAKDDCGALRAVVSLLSQAVGQGHVCLDLEEIAGQLAWIPGRDEPLLLPDAASLIAVLRSLPTLGRPGEHRPLILDDAGRLYLYRYFRYEAMLAESIRARAASQTEGPDDAALAEQLDRYFAPSENSGEDRQRQAALTALRRHFSVISGGPGTGKTTTVVRILGLMLEQPGGERLRIAMAAPTGKAAARLASSIAALRESLPCADEVKRAVPGQVTTIHRLLGTLPASTGFRHNERNPLPCDAVIVDEASMVDLPLMTSLVAALPPQARLILIGDRDQLASVEAGAVLGDICRAAESPGSSIAGCVTVLDRNYRFGDGSGIAALSRAVNAGDDREALRLLADADSAAIALEATPTRETMKKRLAASVLEGFRPFLEAETPAEALRLFDRFRILTALREGPWGATGMNHAAESLLHGTALIHLDSQFYRGRPVLVTENDYIHKLFNGDTGIILPDPDNGHLRAFFAAPDGTVRAIPPEFLPKHETAFAMTVHKSQGSEFDRVLMVLPPEDSILLTRELIYTGITRARQSVMVWSDEAVFGGAVKRRTERRSGLRERLVNG
ncbi:MAG: exodeoxyribonuclease V subunit alpha [Chlorobaculum sp.]|nr:exodeoxyribonuclease V subunit alpha [Chlorobaculum sp.]